MPQTVAATSVADLLARQLAPALASLSGAHTAASVLRATSRVVDAGTALRAADAVDAAGDTIGNEPWNTDTWMALGLVSRALRDPSRAAEFAGYALERARFAGSDALAVGIERGWHSKARNARALLALVDSLHRDLGG